MRRIILAAIAATLLLPVAASAQRKPPYWASIAAGEAMMRTGPGRHFPATWLYRRADLPIRVIKIYPNWRLVEDPGGTRGWMLVNLLSDTRTAIVTAGQAAIHASASDGAAVRYRASKGVVGRIRECASNWCRIKIGKREGFIRTTDVWGADPNEVIE